MRHLHVLQTAYTPVSWTHALLVKTQIHLEKKKRSNMFQDYRDQININSIRMTRRSINKTALWKMNKFGQTAATQKKIFDLYN
jgi:hypothetical protein